MIFQAMGITYILGGEILLPHLHPQRASTYVAGPTTFFVGATLGFHRHDPMAAVLRQRPGRLVDRQPVPAVSSA